MASQDFSKLFKNRREQPRVHERETWRFSLTLIDSPHHTSVILIHCLIEAKCLNAERNAGIFVASQTEDLKVVEG